MAEHLVEVLFVAVLDAGADQLALLRRAVLHQPDQRQGGLAFAQVVADVLADLGAVAE
jgi:hypothetical protein